MRRDAPFATVCLLPLTIVLRVPGLAEEQMPVASNHPSPYLATRREATQGLRNENDVALMTPRSLRREEWD